MNVQRVILLLGMAVTSYLLILAWNEDYHSKLIQAPFDDAVITIPEGERIDRGEDDLPEVLMAADTTPIVESALAAHSVQDSVKVTTNVLNVWIDVRGGDIFRVSLPKFPISLDRPDVPLTLVDPANSYVAQSGLLGDGPDDDGARPVYTAGADYYELSADEEELVVSLIYEDDKARITKDFTFRTNDYLMDVDYRVFNKGQDQWNGYFFAQIKRDGENPSFQDENAMQMRPYVGGATFTEDAPYFKLEFEDMAEGPYKAKFNGGYVAMVQHYFISAWVPKDQKEYRYEAKQLAQGREAETLGPDDPGKPGLYRMGFVGPKFSVAPGQEVSFGAQYYVGPKDQHRLKQIAAGLDLTVDYGFLWWIAQPLFQLLDLIHGVMGNWGIAIILLTLTVKLLLYPLSAASYRSMAKMRKLQPEMQRLKERFGEDRQQFSQAMMDLYKREGANPLGGCLPLMLQMPVFLALYWTLMESVELRQAPLALWIHDLSVMDPYFVLPILMGISMFLTQRMQPEPPDPIQAKVFKMMPIMFTFFFLWFPSGLVLYWLVNNLLSILQQWLVTRQLEASST